FIIIIIIIILFFFFIFFQHQQQTTRKIKNREPRMSKNPNQVVLVHQQLIGGGRILDENDIGLKIREILKKNQPFVLCEDVKGINLYEGKLCNKNHLQLFCDSIKNNHSIQHMNLASL